MGWRRRHIEERAYSLWEAEGRRHGYDQDYWYRAEAETPPMTITFDSNAWQPVVRPDKFSKDPRYNDFLKIKNAIEGGDIKGFICETVATLEAIRKPNRGAYFSSDIFQIRTEITEAADGTIKIGMSVGPDDDKHPGLAAVLSDRLEEATSRLNMRLLRAPRTGLPQPDSIKRTFVIDPEGDIGRRQEKAAEVVRAIEARGVGIAQAKSLGDKIGRRLKQRKPWYKFLDSPKDQEEENRIIKSVAEWADGDSVAAHIGYRLDFHMHGR